MKVSKREKVARVLGRSGLRRLIGRCYRWDGLLVVNYHHIGDGSTSPYDRETWNATPEGLEAQVRALKADCDVVGPGDLDRVAASGRGRFAMITFDDGYADNYRVAFPILGSLGVTATFMLATGFLDRPRLPWWDEVAWMARAGRGGSMAGGPWFEAPVIYDEPDRARAIRAILGRYKALPGDATEAFLDSLGEAAGCGRFRGPAPADLWMTWDMVREMQLGGMTFGGHTVDHPVLANLPEARQAEEIGGCLRRIEEETGRRPFVLSYPVGGPLTADARTRACLKEHGVRYAFSYYGGFRNFKHWDPYDIRRVFLSPRLSLDHFRLMVALPPLFA
jgi:peptidoglycan/xylan/chitin deacetylase (PgdA/CDA1 family)